ARAKKSGAYEYLQLVRHERINGKVRQQAVATLGRLEDRGRFCEWDRLKKDLDAVEEFTVANTGRTFVIRSQVRGDAGKALQAAGVALGPTIRLQA
ncbi:MAG: hypothetical protein ACUVXJ_17260, partial [Phycisphaerae bacterium]